jgi:Predicted xylanase/chitin deacetylase
LRRLHLPILLSVMLAASAVVNNLSASERTALTMPPLPRTHAQSIPTPTVIPPLQGPEPAASSAEQTASSSSAPAVRHAADAAFRDALSQKPKRQRKRRAKKARYSWVALERRHPGAFVTHGPLHLKVAALTFDDAPDPRFTPQILDILARHRVRATFFVVGSRARAHPELVRRIAREGHLIGNHSDTHALLTRKTPAGFEREIRRTDQTLLAITGRKPRFIRPPYGEITPKQTDWTARRGYIVANWNVDAVDWRNTSSRTIIANVRRQIRPGAIILLHAGGGRGQDLTGTINALPKVIAMLKRQGYRLHTLDELLGQRGYRT